MQASKTWCIIKKKDTFIKNKSLIMIDRKLCYTTSNNNIYISEYNEFYSVNYIQRYSPWKERWKPSSILNWVVLDAFIARMLHIGPLCFSPLFFKKNISGCRYPNEMGVKFTVSRQKSLFKVYSLPQVITIINSFHECISLFWYTLYWFVWAKIHLTVEIS